MIGACPQDGIADVGGEGVDLDGVEDATEVDEAGPVQVVPDVGDGILEGEALCEIHLASGRVPHAGRMVEVEGHLPAEGDPQRRLPARLRIWPPRPRGVRSAGRRRRARSRS